MPVDPSPVGGQVPVLTPRPKWPNIRAKPIKDADASQRMPQTMAIGTKAE